MEKQVNHGGECTLHQVSTGNLHQKNWRNWIAVEIFIGHQPVTLEEKSISKTAQVY